MTKDETLQLALDSMKEIINWYAYRDRDLVLLNYVDQSTRIQKIMKSITFIKETLETEEGLLDKKSYLLGLYDQKPWVGLTEDEIVHIGVATGLERVAIEMISNKLKEKNYE
jgi:hypothetical protein